LSARADAARVARGLLGLAAAAIVAHYVLRYPPPSEPPFDARAVGTFDPAKALAALRSLAILVAINASAYALGRPLAERISGGERSELRVQERLALGFLALAVAALALAALRLLVLPAFALLLLAPVLAGAPALAREARDLAGAPRGRIPAWEPAIAAAVLIPRLLAAFVPDYGYDAFVYHLALPERYLFENRVVLTSFSVFSAFPHTVEMLYVLALGLDGPSLAKLLHLELGVLAASAVYLTARQVSRRAGLLALAVLAADPLLLWETTVAYNDLGVTLFAVLACAAFLRWQQTGAEGGLRLSGIFAGACVATKYTGASVPLALLALIFPPPWRKGPRERLRAGALLAAFGLLPVLPWLARNAATTGNPVSPALQGVFHAPGREYFDPVALAQSAAHMWSLGPGKQPSDLLLLPWSLTMRARRGDYAAFGFRVGCLYLVGLVAALLLPSVRRRAEAPTALKIVAVLSLFWFYTFQEPRYLLPALALLAVAAGIALDALAPAGRLARGAFLLAVPAAAVLHTQAHEVRLVPWWYGYALGGLGPEHLESQDPVPVVARRLRGLLGPAERLLLVYEARGWFFRGLDYIPAHTPQGSPVDQVIHRAADAGALREALLGLGVTHVLVNTNGPLRYPIYFVPGYSRQDFEDGVGKLHAFLERHTDLVLAERGVLVRKLRR
jgi:hypothetical protein